jgi:hypothetical protein
MGQDQKNQDIYSILVETGKVDRAEIHKNLMAVLAKANLLTSVNISLLEPQGQLLIYNSIRGGKVEGDLKGKVMDILGRVTGIKYTFLHGASSQGITGVRKIGDPAADERIRGLEAQLEQVQKKAEEQMQFAQQIMDGERINADMNNVAACLVTRDNRLASFRGINQNYSAARMALGEGVSDNTLMGLLGSSGVPFKETEEYKKMVPELEDARRVLEMAMKNRFVETRKPAAFVAKAERVIKEAEEREAKTEGIRAAVKGKHVTYAVYVDGSETERTVSLMMPIEEKEQGALATELVAHAQARMKIMATKELIELREGYVKGLKTFTLVPKGEDVERVYGALVQDIFNSQRLYTFGAAGLRVDIETISSTSGQDISAVEATSQRKTERVTTPLYDGSERALRDTLMEKLPNLPVNIFDDHRGKTRLFNYAAMNVLADTGQSLTQIGVRRGIQSLVQGYDPNSPASQVACSVAIRGLEKEGLVVKEGVGKNATYRLAEKLRRRG